MGRWDEVAKCRRMARAWQVTAGIVWRVDLPEVWTQEVIASLPFPTIRLRGPGVTMFATVEVARTYVGETFPDRPDMEQVRDLILEADELARAEEG